MARLLVYNPSDYPRAGHVCTPWQPIREATGIDIGRIRVLDDQGRALPTQVDRVDPLDPSRDVLTFLLHDALPPGTADYRSVSAVFQLTDDPPGPLDHGPRAEIHRTGFRLVNSRLDTWMYLHAAQDRPWYAGAATSVVLHAAPFGLLPWAEGDRIEVLDAFTSMLGWQAHDPEKRCMQVDRLRLRTRHSEADIAVFETPHDVVCSQSGPVRAFVSLETRPFPCSYPDPFHGEMWEGELSMRRVLSVFHNADYVLDELFLTPIRSRARDDFAPAVEVQFSPSYFAAMDMGIVPEIRHYARVPSWLAIGCPILPFQGYGFATDVPVNAVSNPHPGYPAAKGAHRTFSWELGYARHVRSLHLFRFAEPDALASATGHAWYEHLYQPLRASVASEGSVA